MNKNRLIIGLILAVVVALFMSTYVYHAIKQAGSERPVQLQQIVVASAPIALGSRLDSTNMKSISWPVDAAIPGMLTRVEDGMDRAVIGTVSVNEPILESKLAPKTGGAGLSVVIPEGMRALSVAVNDVVGVAGFVMPGTSVDVLVTGQVIGIQNGVQSFVTRTILENVRVLASGQKIEQDRDGKPQTVSVVTLLVTPEDAAKLTMASTEGKIQLSLRNTIDGKTPSPGPVLQSALFGWSEPAPAPQQARHSVLQKPVSTAPAIPYTVEIIIGGKRESKSFPNQTSQ